MPWQFTFGQLMLAVIQPDERLTVPVIVAVLPGGAISLAVIWNDSVAASSLPDARANDFMSFHAMSPANAPFGSRTICQSSDGQLLCAVEWKE